MIDSIRRAPDFDRLRRALLRQGELDQVPLLELKADDEVVAHLMGVSVELATDRAAGRAGRKFWFSPHSCGNLEAIMDDLIEDVRIDAKHSFEDVILPVERFKARYGSRVGVVGGIDLDLLARGSEQEIRARVRQVFAHIKK